MQSFGNCFVLDPYCDLSMNLRDCRVHHCDPLAHGHVMPFWQLELYHQPRSPILICAYSQAHLTSPLALVYTSLYQPSLPSTYRILNNVYLPTTAEPGK